MTKTSRIGLYLGLAVLGSQAADAQTTTGVGIPSATAGARRSAGSSYYNRTTTATRGNSAYATTRGSVTGYGSSSYGENDPLRPYSEQGRRAAAGVSPTRVAEGPPAPPRPQPQARHNYFPSIRGAQHPNANTAGRPHCTPGRGSVMAGSLGGSGRGGYPGGVGIGGSLGRGR